MGCNMIQYIQYIFPPQTPTKMSNSPNTHLCITKKNSPVHQLHIVWTGPLAPLVVLMWSSTRTANAAFPRQMGRGCFSDLKLGGATSA